METPYEEKPWDIKTLNISLGGEDDYKGFIRLEIFNDDSFGLYVDDKGTGKDGIKEYAWSMDDIDLSAAVRIRDFLIYALGDK